MNHDIANSMLKYGGNFARHLAAAWKVADQNNREKIEATWSDMISEYAEMTRIHAVFDASETAE